jgi:glycosyltransferase involved in cell wall biosynthesis
MKIIFLVPGSIRGNFIYRALAIARALHKQGHEIVIIAPSADKYNDFRPEKITDIDGIKIVQPFQFATKRPEINFLPYLFSATKSALKEKADLIYIYKPTPINIVGFIINFFRKTPILVDMDDLGSEVMRIEGHPRYQRKLVAWSENFAVKYADNLVVASTYLFEKYRKEFPKKQLHIMPNAVESDWFAPLIPSEEKQRIVFMGSLNRRSILEPLLDILPELVTTYPNSKALIIGGGNYLEYFKQKAESSGVSRYVTFTGWLSLEEARSHLHAGDIGYSYMPDELTIKAANNMKVSQYMARGVVPLVSNVGDLPAMVDFGRAGYICEHDNTPALKAMLISLLLEDKERLQKARHARTFVSEKFSWDCLAMDLDRWLSLKNTK